MRDKADHAAIELGFEKLSGLLESDDFVKPMMHHVPRFEQTGLPFINPFKYRRQAEGAFFEAFRNEEGKKVIEIFHSQDVFTRWPFSSKNPFKSFQDLFSLLSDEEMETAKRNPHQLMTFCMPQHVLNFKVGEAVKLFDKDLNVLWEHARKAFAAIEKQALSPEDKAKIVDGFLNSFSQEYHGELRHALESFYKSCSTVRELCDAMVEVENKVIAKAEEKWNTADFVELAIRGLPQFQGKFPSIHWLLDTNSTKLMKMTYGYRIYNKKIQRICSDTTGNSIVPVNLAASLLGETWYFRYRSSLNPYDRTYFVQQF